jgi:manganese efflux pump family protein
MVAIFALVGALAPGVGILAGQLTSRWLPQLATALGVLVLATLGGWMLHGAATSKRGGLNADALGGGSVLLLAMGLSSDNLVVGLGLGLQGASPLGLMLATFVMVGLGSWIGLRVGAAGGRHWGRGALALAGILLLGLALDFLLKGFQ